MNDCEWVAGVFGGGEDVEGQEGNFHFNVCGMG